MFQKAEPGRHNWKILLQMRVCAWVKTFLVKISTFSILSQKRSFIRQSIVKNMRNSCVALGKSLPCNECTDISKAYSLDKMWRST